MKSFEQLLDKFNLDTEGQKKLIEILLIIGSIIVALKLPDNMIWIFMLFVLSSILYFIIIQKNSQFNRLIPLAVSCTFTGIVTVVLFMNLNLPNFATIFFQYLKLLLFGIYYLIFTLIIWLALIRK